MRTEADVPPALELRGIAKSFGALRAVNDVSLAIPEGAVVGIVGENGAGKSTLMNLVYGLLRPDAGEIRVFGKPAVIAGPQDALRLGIGMVHQHFLLVDTFTVAENVLLGAEGAPTLSGGLARLRRALARMAEAYGLSVDPDALAGELSVGDQQRVEIVRALVRGARILILDEPTAVLTPQEADRLFVVLRELAAGGVTVVLITHKLREIMDATRRVFVMRHGRKVAERATAETNETELAALMMGGTAPPAPSRSRAAPGPVRLSARDLATRDPLDGRMVVEGIDLDLRAGEILGVAGVSGNGQGELLEVLAGMRPLARGRLTIGDRAITPERPADAAELRRLGLAHVPEHRHRHGIVGAFSAAETAILGRLADPELGRGLLKPGAVARRCAELMRRFDVRPPAPALGTDRFSGGNQQKLVMAREIAASPEVLLVGQPTRGVDIGAIAFIHGELLRLREAGCAILLVSTELDEILALSDRILVMAGGCVTGEVPGGDVDPGAIGLLMSGIAAPRETVPA